MIAVIHRGIPDELRTDAATLYWAAFGGKLGRVMGPRHRALRFFEQAMRSDHALTALSPNGELLGLVGFKSYSGSMAGGDSAQMRAVYGWFGAAWRGVLLSLMERDVENRCFLIDGICVVPAAQGQGVGTLLLNAIFDEARAREYPAVRLDVIDSNARARALYEQLGFVALRTERLGLLRHLFGFDASISMVKEL
ncbi:N-acetyltransferase [Pseudorhodobacter sp.]|uniref:GNAT family N-acetyltransferase n=1 Tax=Pseudorhodobacter sp. TaxID=1934400 RepID=UPI00264830DD|nr:GNAT family N-acetyltransferase [Pseudorhodobacter sp.]MDN5785519.1 GNAT family N-acetyltransferase [Pseudorhodobacter sp.]